MPFCSRPAYHQVKMPNRHLSPTSWQIGLPSLYGIKEQDMEYYLSFSIIIIFFQLCVDIFIHGVLELFHGWKIYDYLVSSVRMTLSLEDGCSTRHWASVKCFRICLMYMGILHAIEKKGNNNVQGIHSSISAGATLTWLHRYIQDTGFFNGKRGGRDWKIAWMNA